jgi:hypothetical protein
MAFRKIVPVISPPMMIPDTPMMSMASGSIGNEMLNMVKMSIFGCI